ncbi:9593_t:CDS:1 [Paraglomus brasilianum]|uniref:9593_t:CDS:1 n=1 Tax=Paraglomus brasilianum TaxID=144538 RepID=A0A9N9D0Q9_9GLOM|nr:9593_t:CDS:1 [Paraglomus brasilianum]
MQKYCTNKRLILHGLIKLRNFHSVTKYSILYQKYDNAELGRKWDDRFPASEGGERRGRFNDRFKSNDRVERRERVGDRFKSIEGEERRGRFDDRFRSNEGEERGGRWDGRFKSNEREDRRERFDDRNDGEEGGRRWDNRFNSKERENRSGRRDDRFKFNDREESELSTRFGDRSRSIDGEERRGRWDNRFKLDDSKELGGRWGDRFKSNDREGRSGRRDDRFKPNDREEFNTRSDDRLRSNEGEDRKGRWDDRFKPDNREELNTRSDDLRSNEGEDRKGRWDDRFKPDNREELNTRSDDLRSNEGEDRKGRWDDRFKLSERENRREKWDDRFKANDGEERGRWNDRFRSDEGEERKGRWDDRFKSIEGEERRGRSNDRFKFNDREERGRKWGDQFKSHEAEERIDRKKKEDPYLSKEPELKIYHWKGRGSKKAALGESNKMDFDPETIEARRLWRAKFEYNHEYPEELTRVHGVTNPKIIHLQKLRENRQYREEVKQLTVQGEANVRALHQRGIPITSLYITAPYKPKTKYEIQPPALDYIKNPRQIPADQYYLINIDMARKVLGTAARPEDHDIFAEISHPDIPLPTDKKLDKVLIMDGVNEATDVGSLIRTAKALGYDGSFMGEKTCDLYDDFVQRFSGFHSITWPHTSGDTEKLYNLLHENDLSLVVVQVMPSNQPNPPPRKLIDDSNLLFWTLPRDLDAPFPKKIATYISVTGPRPLLNRLVADEKKRHNIWYVSIPMKPEVSKMDISAAGGIAMFEIERVLARSN